VRKTSPFLIWILLIILINIIGISGFMLIDHFSFLDAFYMTVITITTIGYMEVRPLSHDGKIFNIFFIITSFAAYTYALASLTRYVVSGELYTYFKNRKLMQALNKMSNHVILCGFGRNGQQAANTLKTHKVPFVAIDFREHNIDDYLRNNPDLVYIKGDATQDDLLIKAGIDRARGLICALPTDADNVFIVLSARSLNPAIKIVSRASQVASVLKLKKAGADNVIMPDKIGGNHMATLVTKPDVIEFIDFLSGEQGESINIESVAYDRLPPEIRDQPLHVVMDWKKTGVNCIGIKDVLGTFIINPPQDTVISKGMKVIVLGDKNQIHLLKHNVGEE
jgi:voltage-gated potassium channel